MITTPQRWKSHHRVEAKRRRRANRVAYQAWESIRLPVFTATALGVAAATSYSFHTTLSLVLTPVLYVFLGYLTRSLYFGLQAPNIVNSSINIWVASNRHGKRQHLLVPPDCTLYYVMQCLERKDGFRRFKRIQHTFSYSANWSSIAMDDRLCDIGAVDLSTIYLNFYVLGGSRAPDTSQPFSSPSSPNVAGLTAVLMNTLTKEKILALSANHTIRLPVPASTRRTKEAVITHILLHGDDSLHRLLLNAIQRPVSANSQPAGPSCANPTSIIPDVTTAGSTSQKRPPPDASTPLVSRKAARVEQDARGQFMEVPSPDEIRECHKAFYCATSTEGVRSIVCGVCARENDLSDTPSSYHTMSLDSIPNGHLLKPHTPNSAHTLYKSMLLDDAGMQTDSEGKVTVTICSDCWRELSSPKKDLPPRFSLANDMWIGKVPWELQGLTFPEQLLIAQLYPRVYVFKLFPKKIQGQRNADTLQRGMRGNVTTFELDPEGVQDMLSGNLMPRPPAVLASLITVTFVGLGKLPKSWLKNTFSVRRQTVKAALLKLKEICPKYYGDIVIDEGRLASLPEDGVPDEIMEVVRQSEDAAAVDEEGATSYVPTSEDAEPNAVEIDSISATGASASDSPDVIPLQISGAIDTDLSKLTANELMQWGLLNLTSSDEPGYAVRHGSDAVSDFGRPMKGKEDGTDRSTATGANFFERAFPLLFPYGCGGIEADRPNPVGFNEHIRWALQHHDRRFRRHETFPFISFGIQQRRQALGAARLQARRRNFETDAHLLSTITPQILKDAQNEEAQGKRVSSPAVNLLKSHIHAVAGKVMGSNASKHRLKSQIWSTSIALGPPSLWITINPDDLHDPIAQIFAGQDINMDNFLSTIGPDDHARAKGIAQDPYAAAKFFHFLIATILSTLLGVDATDKRVKSEKGIFGYVSAYFGVVESQGRGSLHLHLLVWLRHAPTLAEMQRLLQDEDFRRKVSDYIRANSRGYVPGLESKEAVRLIPNQVDVAWSRPPNPTVGTPAEYEIQRAAFELCVARAKQVHTCEMRRCLKVDYNGRLTCKRRAPFETSMAPYVHEDGQWCPARWYEYMNAWNPSLTVCLRGNNDLKVLLNGRETVNISYYVTGYSHKNQQKNHNVSAVIADNFAYHLQRTAYTDSLHDTQRLLILRIVHAMNSEQELAAPMVISFLMGWGDQYLSHRYTPVYWSSFVGALLKDFPTLAKTPYIVVDVLGKSLTYFQSLRGKDDRENNDSQISDDLLEKNQETPGTPEEDGDETVTLKLDARGKLHLPSQVTDYRCRGTGLEHVNVYDFFCSTWETESSKPAEEKIPSTDAEASHPSRRRGRPPHFRHPYTSEHPSSGKLVRVERSEGHNTLPNFVGRYFVKRDAEEDTSDMFYATMLLLLKPWRTPSVDLKQADESWRDAYTSFISGASRREANIVEGIQFFHSCQGAAQAVREAEQGAALQQAHEEFEEVVHNHEHLEDLEETSEDDIGGVPMTRERLEFLKVGLRPVREDNWGKLAVIEGQKGGMLSKDTPGVWSVEGGSPAAANCTGDDLTNLIAWQAQMDKEANTLAGGEEIVTGGIKETPTNLSGRRSGVAPQVEVLRQEGQPVGPTAPELFNSSAGPEAALPSLDVERLRTDQRRAYNIVEWHLKKQLAGSQPKPLRMMIHGEGGTGKSR